MSLKIYFDDTMSRNILDIFSLTDYDNPFDPFQRALPAARTNPPQNNQFLDSIALTQFQIIFIIIRNSIDWSENENV